MTVLALAAATLVSGCGLGKTSTAAPTGGGSRQSGSTQSVGGATAVPTDGTLTGAWIGPCCTGVDDVNPLLAGSDAAFLDKIYEHLTTYSIDPASHGFGSLMPELAAGWTSSSDGKTWTFQLRPNVRWQDGTPLTSADVAFSIALCLDPTAGGCTAAGSLSDIAGASAVSPGATAVSGVQTPNDSTVTITTTDADATVPDTLSRVWILQQRSLSAIPRDQLSASPYWTTPGQAVGTGPFRLAAYSAGKSMELDANENYWRGKPHLAKLVRLEFSDPASARAAFDAGQVDFTYLTADEVAAESANANAVVVSVPSTTTEALALNPHQKPFDDQKVRLAFAKAIDPALIARTVYNGAATAIPCLFGGAAFAGVRTNAAPDQSLAKQLFQAGLQEEGFPGPQSLPRLTLDAGQTDALTRNVLQALAQEWQQVLGVSVVVQPLAPSAWRQRYQSGQSQISLVAVDNGPDPNVGFSYLAAASKWPRGENEYAVDPVGGPTIDQLLQSARSGTTSADRTAGYASACQAIVNSAVWISLWQPSSAWAVSKKAGNVIVGPSAPMGSFDDQAQTWYVQR